MKSIKKRVQVVPLLHEVIPLREVLFLEVMFREVPPQTKTSNCVARTKSSERLFFLLRDVCLYKTRRNEIKRHRIEQSRRIKKNRGGRAHLGAPRALTPCSEPSIQLLEPLVVNILYWTLKCISSIKPADREKRKKPHKSLKLFLSFGLERKF